MTNETRGQNFWHWQTWKLFRHCSDAWGSESVLAVALADVVSCGPHHCSLVTAVLKRSFEVGPVSHSIGLCYYFEVVQMLIAFNCIIYFIYLFTYCSVLVLHCWTMNLPVLGRIVVLCVILTCGLVVVDSMAATIVTVQIFICTTIAACWVIRGQVSQQFLSVGIEISSSCTHGHKAHRRVNLKCSISTVVA